MPQMPCLLILGDPIKAKKTQQEARLSMWHEGMQGGLQDLPVEGVPPDFY